VNLAPEVGGARPRPEGEFGMVSQLQKTSRKHTLARQGKPEFTELASGFKVSDYIIARSRKDRVVIADAIRRRFCERYVLPVSGPNRHGFTSMAVSCLMAEAFESFRHGWPTTERRSEVAFDCFFKESRRFVAFRSHAHGFYRNVRCAILHQAETTSAWRIRRSGPMFDPHALSINATKFLKALVSEVYEFCDNLIEADWDGEQWINVRAKIDAIVKGCMI